MQKLLCDEVKKILFILCYFITHNIFVLIFVLQLQYYFVGNTDFLHEWRAERRLSLWELQSIVLH